MDLRDYLSILFRHKGLAALVFVSCIFFFLMFSKKAPEKYVAKVELNVSVANLYIQTTPTKFLIPNFTNQQLLRYILRSDAYYEDILNQIAEIYPAEFPPGKASQNRLRNYIKYEFDGGSPGNQISTVFITVSTDNQAKSDNLMEFAIELFQRRLEYETELKTQNEIASVVKVRAEVKKKYSEKLRALEALREEQQSNSAKIQLAAHQAHLQELSSLILHKDLNIDQLKLELTELGDKALGGDSVSVTADISKWKTTIQELRYNYNLLVQQYSDKSPRVQQAEKELLEAERSLLETQYHAEQSAIIEAGLRMEALENEIAFEKRVIIKLGQERDKLIVEVKTLVEKQNRVQNLEDETHGINDMVSELNKYETELNVRMGQKDMFIHTVARSPSQLELSSKAPLQTSLLVLLLSIIAATFATYIRELLSIQIESEQDIRKYLSLPVVIRIPKLGRSEEKILTRISPSEWFSELFKNLALIITSNLSHKKFNVIEITSTSKEEGKSTIAVNLAISLARLDNKVLILDCDLRAPAVHQMLKLNKRGIREYIDECNTAEKTLEHHEYIQELASVPHLFILTAGDGSGNEVQILRSAYFRQMIATLREDYDFLIIDTPPISFAAEALLLGEISDNIYLVVAQGETNKKMAQESVSIIQNAGLEFKGILFNKSQHHLFGGRDYYKYYYYSYNRKR